MVELLVKHGAKLNVLTVRGYTPLDRCVFHYVIGNYNKEILKILVRAGAKLKPLTSQPGYDYVIYISLIKIKPCSLLLNLTS